MQESYLQIAVNYISLVTFIDDIIFIGVVSVCVWGVA